jgi:hypothetical protein
MKTIIQPVGIRNGVTMMPNNQGDLRTVTGLLDRIPLTDGGTAATPRLWSSDRSILIAQVTATIATFQTVNRRPVVDGVVDPGGGTLRLMNQLAAPGPVTATVVIGDVDSQFWEVADPASLDGTDPLRPLPISPPLTRKLIEVDGTSIKWFGVVVPLSQSGAIAGGVPHIFFTPSPNQNGYNDGEDYNDNFTTEWYGLWDKYTSIIGSQLIASGAPQILVIPFYQTSQLGNLGSFLANWREVISGVLTTAISSIDPLFLRDTFQFDEIFTSSFSNGIYTHQNFNTRGAGVASMTRRAFDLDGQAAHSHWRPNRAVVYSSRPVPPGSTNPEGTLWRVGGRFAQFLPFYPSTSEHNLCPFLLLHGLSRFGR